MATASIKKGTDAAGTAVATHSFTEDAETRHLQRVVLSDSAGRELTASDTATAAAAVSVTNASAATLLAANPARRGFRIVHAGETVYVGHTVAVTSSTGLPLFATAPYEQRGDGVYRGAIYAICAATEGPTSVRVQEW